MDAVNPVVVHCWEQDGVSYENGDNTYVAQVGTIRYRQKVTDDNNVDPVVGEWSDPVVAEEKPPTPDVPDADMHGLRFEASRSTWLQTDQQVSGSVFTYSVWLKPTNSTSTNTSNLTFIESNPNASNNLYRESFRVNDDGKTIRCINGPADAAVWSNVLNPLTWNHVVIVASAYNKRQVYVNGVDKGEQSIPGAANPINRGGLLYVGNGLSDKNEPLMVTCLMHILLTEK